MVVFVSEAALPTLPDSNGPREAPRTNALALWALVFSVLGFTCMWGFGGLLGIAFGVMAKGEIDRARGAQRGRGLATSGIVIGSLNLIACVVAVAVGVTWLASPGRHSPTAKSPPLFAAPTTPMPAPPPTTASSAAPKPAAGDALSSDSGVIVTRIGRIDLVDIGSDVRSLGDELDKQRELGERSGKKLLLWVVQGDCQPCNGVAAALLEPSMQTALEGVRLVRLDPREFALELRQFNIPIDKIPGFALLGTDQRPTDYVNGGEWGEDIAANIAPVLGKFVRGAYTKRRDPWRGGSREDETAL
jgi:hypothetical protein